MKKAKQQYGRFIKNRRLQLGWSFRLLAGKLGISHATLQKVESGCHYLNPVVHKKLSGIIRIPYEELEAYAGRACPDVVRIITKNPVKLSEYVRNYMKGGGQ